MIVRVYHTSLLIITKTNKTMLQIYKITSKPNKRVIIAIIECSRVVEWLHENNIMEATVRKMNSFEANKAIIYLESHAVLREERDAVKELKELLVKVRF